MGKRKNGLRMYDMDYIGNRDLFAAVMFSRKMIREGTDPWIANDRSARYYSVDVSDVAHYVAQAAGTIGGRRKNGVKR
jgi:hypothetical protein